MAGLADETIIDGASVIGEEEIRQQLETLPGWNLVADGNAIEREWHFKTFRQAAQLANLAAWQAEEARHHPDIAFGWGWARITFTTHSAKGVTLNDLIMAARLSQAVD
ncbi:4a-hydroxytetrahydrobiopterin dehydratase [Paracoccus sp. MBLB3053]|uniref:Putative pterin-4-alpha-carbinolamine dehydratase n=1 Tax=Paracoccus aurantius TaxID=3073814 RepID=A0ABU2HMG6_9RHOB|nr:4a-hydroxytetrahydrobiopterin dehydratase [Paracoccus sp. MBLB3053]MDS9466233.1 4a-hydroxytetrahydrobiopterin dehydratase [Paracoccus sp. MBLB3053]